MLMIFDIDGTLTDPRQSMDPLFKEWFIKFCSKHTIYFCTGSDYPRVLEQVGQDLAELVNGVWSCSGNELYIAGKMVNSYDWKAPKALIDKLDDMLSLSKSPSYGKHIRHRTGMINFSFCGRNATQEQREQYRDWDKLHGERKIAVKQILEDFPQLYVAIGGEISIDITTKGRDKSQILSYFSEGYKPILFADKCQPGGNDYLLACLLDDIYEIDGGFRETWSILKKIG